MTKCTTIKIADIITLTGPEVVDYDLDIQVQWCHSQCSNQVQHCLASSLSLSLTLFRLGFLRRYKGELCPETHRWLLQFGSGEKCFSGSVWYDRDSCICIQFRGLVSPSDKHVHLNWVSGFLSLGKQGLLFRFTICSFQLKELGVFRGISRLIAGPWLMCPTLPQLWHLAYPNQYICLLWLLRPQRWHHFLPLALLLVWQWDLEDGWLWPFELFCFTIPCAISIALLKVIFLSPIIGALHIFAF